MLQTPPDLIERYRRQGWWSDALITDYLDRWAQEKPDQVAMVSHFHGIDRGDRPGHRPDRDPELPPVLPPGGPHGMDPPGPGGGAAATSGSTASAPAGSSARTGAWRTSGAISWRASCHRAATATPGTWRACWYTSAPMPATWSRATLSSWTVGPWPACRGCLRNAGKAMGRVFLKGSGETSFPKEVSPGGLRRSQT